MVSVVERLVKHHLFISHRPAHPIIRSLKHNVIMISKLQMEGVEGGHCYKVTAGKMVHAGKMAKPARA